MPTIVQSTQWLFLQHLKRYHVLYIPMNKNLRIWLILLVFKKSKLIQALKSNICTQYGRALVFWRQRTWNIMLHCSAFQPIFISITYEFALIFWPARQRKSMTYKIHWSKISCSTEILRKTRGGTTNHNKGVSPGRTLGRRTISLSPMRLKLPSSPQKEIGMVMTWPFSALKITRPCVSAATHFFWVSSPKEELANHPTRGLRAQTKSVGNLSIWFNRTFTLLGNETLRGTTTVI